MSTFVNDTFAETNIYYETAGTQTQKKGYFKIEITIMLYGEGRIVCLSYLFILATV